MAKVRKKSELGIRLKPTDLTVNTHSAEGEISVDSNDDKLKVRLDSSDRSVVTEDQSQTITNKTIDADNNIISNIETGNLKAGVLITDISTATSDTELPSALAVKTALEGQNEASEIDYAPAVPSDYDAVHTKVAPALDELASRVKINEGDISQNTSDIGDVTTDLSTHEGATSGIHGVTGNVVGDTDIQTLTNKTISGGTLENASIETPTRADVKQDTLANLITYASSASNGQLVFATDEKKMFQVVDTELQPVGGAGGTTIEIDQTAHGLAVGEGIRHDGANWVKALADDGATLATFVVTEVPNVNKFIAYQFGRVEITAHGFTVGQYYFLSNSVAGQATSTEPITDYSNPLFYVESANFLQVMVYRPSVVGEQTPLNDLSDVNVVGAEDKQSLKLNGSTWESSFIDENVIQITSNEAMAIRTPVYISSIGQVNKLDCTDDNKIEFIGFTREATVGAEVIDVVVSGKMGGFSGLTIGEFVYADPSVVGGIIQPKPTQLNVYQIILGKAISATEILINPDLAASAEFNREVTVSNNTITNNQASPASVAGAVFDGAEFRSVILNYSIYRKTDSNEVSQVGQLRLSYKTVANSWSMSDDFSGDDAGVTFSIDATGQVLYISTDLTGTNYESKLQLDVINLFGV